jgi:hypothetical protein
VVAGLAWERDGKRAPASCEEEVDMAAKKKAKKAKKKSKAKKKAPAKKKGAKKK